MLLEREDQLAMLSQAIEDARGGSGRMILVAGEAGSGKTTLIRAFADQTEASVLIIQGACDPLSTPRPLSPLYDFAADPDAGLEDLPLGQADNIEVFRTILDRLGHTRRPVILIVEDIHWADEATLDFLRYVGRRIGDTKGLLVCTYRDDEISSEHQLRPVLGQLIPLPTTERLFVPMLSPSAVETLAYDTDLDSDALHRLTEGNAFYVSEVIASGDTLPSTVQEAVLARVALLGPGAQEVVQAVSIAPRALEVDRALLLVGGDSSSIDSGVASGVLLGDGRNVRFRHELARSAVEQWVPPAKRHTLHTRMIGLLLEEDPLDHARLAHHAIQARSPELIVEHAPAAAREATARHSRSQAIDFYRAALDHAELIEPHEAALMRIELGTHLRYRDQPEESLEALDQAIDYLRSTDDVENLSEALSQKEGDLWHLNRMAEAQASGREAIEVLQAKGASEQLGYALYRSAHMHMLARHAEPARRDQEAAAAMAREVGSEKVVWLSEMMRGCVMVVLGQAEEGIDVLDQSRQRAIKMGNQFFEAIALSMLGSGGGEARLYEPALKALDEGISIGKANDEDYSVSYDLAWKARIRFEQGRWAEAAEEAEECFRVSAKDFGIGIVTAKGALGRLRVRRGDPHGRETLEEVLEIGKDNELQHIWSPMSGLAEYHWMKGDIDTMVEILAEPYQRALNTDSEWAHGELGFWMWKAGAIERPTSKAADPFRLHMEGDWRASAVAWREIGCPYEVALALTDGDVDAKLEALSIFDSLGARPMSDRTRADLRVLGLDSIPRGPARSTLENPAGLTNRQLEVLGLMRDGLSNSEIADQLFISKKTVEHHVSAIFAKLGVDSREDAVAAIGQTS